MEKPTNNLDEELRDALKDLSDIEVTKKQEQALREMIKFYKSFLKNSLKNYSLGQDFIYCARADLNNAKLLANLKGKRHRLPLIVYLIQQSVEKYTKAYSLVLGAISRNNMKNRIGHVTGKAFIKVLRNQDLQQIFKKINKVSDLVYIGEMNKQIKSIKLEDFAKETEDLMISGEVENSDIKELLDAFDIVRKELRKSFISKEFDKELYEGFAPSWRKAMDYFFPSDNMIKQRDILVTQYDLICFLYPMAFITPKHISSTRYPIIDGEEKLWTKDYVSGNIPIVKETRRMIENLERIDKNIGTLMKKFKNLTQLSDKQLEKHLNRTLSGLEQFKNLKEII